MVRGSKEVRKAHSERPFSERLPIPGAPLLTQEEERELVGRLCELRAEMTKRIRPVVEERAPDAEKLEHFDQLYVFFLSLKGVASGLRRWFLSRMKEYAQIKHQLVVRNLLWVTKLSRSNRASTLGEDDLFQEGIAGFLKAIDRFDADRGLRLMTYATWYIREAMQQARARTGHIVTLTSHDQRLLSRVEQARQDFQQEQGRLPTPAEIAARVDRPSALVSDLEAATGMAVSIDRGAEEGTYTIATEDPIIEYDRLDAVKGIVTRLLGSLTPKERAVVTRRFGLDGSTPASLEALGSSLQLSKERIRQLQRQALKRMQKLARDNSPQLEI